MLVKLVMPKAGLTMVEASVIRWIRKEGDVVAEGDPIVEIETEKANIVVPALDAGKIARIVAEPGSVVPVGETLALLEVTASAVPASLAERAAGARENSAHAGPAAAPAVVLEQPGPERGVRASPLARRIARELDVDWSTLDGTGPEGLVTEADVRAARAASAAAPGGIRPARTEPLSPMRRAIAAAMSRSSAEAPQVTLTRDVGIAGVSTIQQKWPEQISFTDVMLATLARVLRRHPSLNAHLVHDELQLFDTVNVALAIAVENGLLTPVIREVHRKSPAEIARERRELVQKARNNTFRPLDFEGGTFTVSNLGPYGIHAFTPILTPPQVATLGVGAAGPQPVVRDNAIVIHETCPLSLTFDHRALDGAPAALFLADLAKCLDDADLLMKELQ
jgi:pyruvate dehydrogenase E2 component (dihydrolipoamide acetyltransferase)